MNVRSFTGRCRLDTSHLWPLIILAAFAFYVSLVPTPPNDLWWHLQVGKAIGEGHTIPSTNQFAWTLPADKPYVYGVWLGDVLMYLLYHLGGVKLLTATRTLIMTIAFWLVAVEARRKTGSWRVAALILAFACTMSLNNAVVRPQIWSFLPVMVFAVLLDRFVHDELSPRWLLACPLLMSIWVNLHGAFVLGLVLIAAFLVGEAVGALVGPAKERARRRLGWLSIVGVLTAFATLVNPNGVKIVDYVYKLMTDPTTQRLLADWQPPMPSGVSNVAFYLSVLLLVFLSIYSHYRPTPAEALLIGGFLWLAWSGQRYVIWYGLLVMPVLARMLGGLSVRLSAAVTRRSWANTALALLLFVPVVMVQPSVVARAPCLRSTGPRSSSARTQDHC